MAFISTTWTPFFFRIWAFADTSFFWGCSKTGFFCIVTSIQNCNNCEPFLHRSIVSLLVASSSGHLPARCTCNMAIRLERFPRCQCPNKGVAIGIGTLRYNRYMSLRRLDTGSSLPRKKTWGFGGNLCRCNVGFGCDFVLASVDESSAHRISSRQASVFRANLCSKTVSHQVFPQNDGEISLK